MLICLSWLTVVLLKGVVFVQILVSKYHIPLRGSRNVWEMADMGLRKGRYKNLEHFGEAECKKCSKYLIGSCPKDREAAWRASQSPNWDNLTIRTNGTVVGYHRLNEMSLGAHTEIASYAARETGSPSLQQNVEFHPKWMTELANLHFATIMVKIDSGQDHQWMPHLMGGQLDG